MVQDSQAAQRAQNAGATSPPDASAHPYVGRVVKERYRIVRCLGHGAMGNVFEVVHEGLRTSFALKQLRADLEGEQAIVARFRDEAEMMARLAHPHIVRVFDIDTEPGFGTWMAMELIHGTDLGSLLQRDRLPCAEAVRIAAQIASALECAHRAGLVHRDIKPPNVLIEVETERAVLTDFGIAKHVRSHGEDTATRTGAFLGTYRYSSPEQIRNLRGVTVDARADVYSLGVVLYEMVSGRKFLDGWSESEIVSRVGFAADWRPPLVYDAAPPAELERLVAACLEPVRERRLGSAGEVTARLAACREAAAAWDAAAPVVALHAARAASPDASPGSGRLEGTAATVAPRAPGGVRGARPAIRSASRAGRPRWRRALGAALVLVACALGAAWLADVPLDPRRALAPAEPPKILSFEPAERLVTVSRGGGPRWFSVVLEGLDPDRPPDVRWLLDDVLVAQGTTLWEYEPRDHSFSTRKPGVLRVVVGKGRKPRESHTWWIQTTVPDLSPVLRSASHKPGSTILARLGDVVDITVDAYDPDGDPLTFSWRLDGRPVGGNAASLALPVTGSHTVSLAISDGDATVWSTWDVRTPGAR